MGGRRGTADPHGQGVTADPGLARKDLALGSTAAVKHAAASSELSTKVL